jgi:zinc/manganese transport system substrate-binding protein
MRPVAIFMIIASVALPSRGQAQDLKVVTTLTTYAAIVREIIGDAGTAHAIAHGDEDPHYVQPKPSYVSLIRDADLFVTTGMDLELWVPTLLDRAGNRAVLPGAPGYVAASTGVDVVEIPVSADRSQGDIHIYGNPHLLTDPWNAILVARNILAGLSRVAPALTATFEEAERHFERRVAEALIGEELVAALTVEATLQLLSTNTLYDFLAETTLHNEPLTNLMTGWFANAAVFRDRAMVCYHREWSYFSRRFGIPCLGYVEPKLGIPPTPRHVRDLIDLMRSQSVPAIFAANYYPSNQINQVADRTGATPVIVPENTEGEAGIDTYFQLVDHWITSLAAPYR